MGWPCSDSSGPGAGTDPAHCRATLAPRQIRYTLIGTRWDTLIGCDDAIQKGALSPGLLGGVAAPGQVCFARRSAADGFYHDGSPCQRGLNLCFSRRTKDKGSLLTCYGTGFDTETFQVEAGSLSSNFLRPFVSHGLLWHVAVMARSRPEWHHDQSVASRNPGIADVASRYLGQPDGNC